MLTISRIFILSIIIFVLTAVSGETVSSTGIRRLGFAIQMGAFADVKNAERLTTRLQTKGIEAFYFRKDNGIYAVRFGDFPSRDKARKIAEKLVEDRLITSYYIAPPNEIVFSKPKAPSWQNSQSDNSRKAETPRTDKPKEPSDGTVKGGDTPEKPSVKMLQGNRDMGTIAARTAERFVGIPYRWGGNTVVDGMDCSGFARAVYNLCGVSIPRTSRDQYTSGESVLKDDLQDGDLVFFGDSETKINHVGIYVGSRKFVHAPRRGEEIRITNIDDNYFEKRFIGARRYF